MSNAPEGRTYMKKKWVLDPDIESGKRPSRHNHRYYDQDEYVIQETPYVVPNGKWAIMRPTGVGWCKLVGVDHTEVEDITLDNLYGVYNVIYTSDKPFGFVTAEQCKYVLQERQAAPVGNRYLHVAQKIHKGELLPGITIPSIEIARQAAEPRKLLDPTRGRDQKRNHIRWARLTDVITASGLSAEEVLLGYWPFIGRSIDHYTGRHGILLHIIVQGSALSISSWTPRILFLDQDEVRQFSSWPLENVWIRAGLAKTILRLQALGVQPEVTQPA